MGTMTGTMGCGGSKIKDEALNITPELLGKSGLTLDDWQWMVNHKGYDERELYEMLRGLQEDFPDGGIFRYQFESFFPDMKMGKNMADMVFSVLDSDHNGYLDFKEFQQAIDLVGARLPDDRLRWSFRLYDVDNSGSVDLDEMINVMTAMYSMFEGMGESLPGKPKDRAVELFRKIDLNGDG